MACFSWIQAESVEQDALNKMQLVHSHNNFSVLLKKKLFVKTLFWREVFNTLTKSISL